MGAPEPGLWQSWGPWAAILAMAAATYLCRLSGVALMSRVRMTERLRRGLEALPGSIIVATVLPIAVESGAAAIAGVLAAAATMALARNEIAGLAAGLATVAALRAAGW